MTEDKKIETEFYVKIKRTEDGEFAFSITDATSMLSVVTFYLPANQLERLSETSFVNTMAFGEMISSPKHGKELVYRTVSVEIDAETNVSREVWLKEMNRIREEAKKVEPL